MNEENFKQQTANLDRPLKTIYADWIRILLLESINMKLNPPNNVTINHLNYVICCASNTKGNGVWVLK